MTKKEELELICQDSLVKLNLLDRKYKSRLKWELIEIEVQDAYDYLFEIRAKVRNRNRTIINERNMLVPFLLGICNEVDIEREPDFIVGEGPDIDVDYLGEIRDYIKQVWAPKTFGENKVANIGLFGTYHANMALIDMARLFDAPRNEVLAVTTKLPPKDDDGKPLTWDTAMEIPAFKEYCDKYPEIADAAKHLCGKNRNIGQHAAGLIISGRDLREVVPVMSKDYQLATAWTEGQSNSDLSSIGLVKFDLLVVDALQHIVDTLQLIKKRHGLTSICAIPGQASWSDTDYLNDPKSLAMAAAGDLKMIFQFGSPGIRALARKANVTCFEDLVALTALYRPGTLSLKMDESFCKRKNGEEEYEIHPLLHDILKDTFGILVFQEQVMLILNIVGKIPLRDCYQLIKAISKKKLGKFAKYKDEFIANGQIVLNCKQEFVDDMFKKIESFAGYSFNSSHSVAYTYITMRELYLKSHYPLDYFAAGLNHINGANPDAKLRELRSEIENHSIRIRKPDINQSKVEFDIVGEDIYFGFATLKGIGVDIAKRIVACQPYNGLKDFLQRFGTEAKVVMPLIALGCFEGDKLDLYKYYELWRAALTKRDNSLSRSQGTLSKYTAKIQAITSEVLDEYPVDYAEKFVDQLGDLYYKELYKLIKSYHRSLTTYNENKISFEEYIQSIFDMDVSDISINDPEILEILTQPEKAEERFFGFVWTHPLEKCKEAKKLTFEKYKLESYTVGPVEVMITKMTEKVGKVRYFLLDVEDLNWESAQVTVWEGEYERFKEQLKTGNTLRLRLKAPDPGFSRYTLESFPKWKKHLIPSLDRDSRVIKID